LDILLYNSKDELVTAYTTNSGYENGESVIIKNESKNYKVVDIEKYKMMGHAEQVALQLKVVK